MQTHRSLKRAIEATSFLSKSREWRIPSSISKLFTYWKVYKSVVHLHAADLMFERTGHRWRYENDNLIAFLSLAEYLRGLGCAQRAPIGRTGSKDSENTFLLDESSTWRPPVDLPLLSSAPYWELPPLSDSEIYALDVERS